jgi:peptidoglycan/LPS O-acetylase OafA/YrhL
VVALPAHDESATIVRPGRNRFFFENLDGLLGPACMLVFSQHACGPLISRLADYCGYLAWPTRKISTHGRELGISFFFVLSGFLITFLILVEIKNKGRIDIASFYVDVFWEFGLCIFSSFCLQL